MRTILILVFSLYCINAKLTSNKICHNCLGKIHTKEELQLSKQPLIIDKIHNCHREKYKFIIIVKSGDFQRRQLTRTTWAKEITEHFNIPVLYAIGYPMDPIIQEDIIDEDEKYHDIIQFNIIESYYNLTLKTTNVFLWYDRHCSSSSRYLLYVDDDLLIHVDQLILYMHKNTINESIQGFFEKSGKIQRKGIGGVSKEDFPIDAVPDYLWGAAVLYPSYIVSNILINAIFNSTIPIFFRDDVFINGFVAEEAGVKREHMEGISLYDPTEDDLQKNMIIIDFKTEEDRLKAWICYKYGRKCNKNLNLLLFKIFCGISLFLIIIGCCCKYVMKTVYCYRLRHECNQCFYELCYPLKQRFQLMVIINRKQHIKTGMQQIFLMLQCLINFRILCIKIVCIFIILSSSFYLLMKSSNLTNKSYQL